MPALTTGDPRRVGDASVLGLEDRVELIAERIRPTSPVKAGHLLVVEIADSTCR